MRWTDAKWGLLPVVAATLLACGGGGGSSETDGGQTTVTTGNVSLSGSAASGLALEGATVDVKCATGSGAATTTSAGSYSVTLSNAALPCVLRVSSADGNTTYHSVAAGSGAGSVVANVTPLTELVVAKATGMSPAEFFSNFSSAQTQTISASSLDAAVTATAQALGSAVTLNGLNPLTATLTPATTANPEGGNAYDQLLDQLQAAITNAGTSLTALTTSAASGGSTIGSLLTSDLASALADGFFGLEYEEGDAGVMAHILVDVHATGPAVGGVFPLDGSGYIVNAGAWTNVTRDTTYNGWILGPTGWVHDGSGAFAATIQQTGSTTFKYLEAGSGLNQIFSVGTSSISSIDLSAFTPNLSGVVALPAGSKRFDLTITNGADEYRLNGGEGFYGITTLADLRAAYESAGTNILTDMAYQGDAGQMGWQFGAGTTSGTLYLYTGVLQGCTAGCPTPVAAPANGTWQVITKNGQQIMELSIPAAAGSSGLLTGQKYIYAVTPNGTAQEGKFSPTGTFVTQFANVNRTAMNAVMAALGLPAAPN